MGPAVLFWVREREREKTVNKSFREREGESEREDVPSGFVIVVVVLS